MRFRRKRISRGMDGSRELFLGAVLHKAFIIVNEQGTEAAAATALIMQTKALSFPTLFFVPTTRLYF